MGVKDAVNAAKNLARRGRAVPRPGPTGPFPGTGSDGGTRPGRGRGGDYVPRT